MASSARSSERADLASVVVAISGSTAMPRAAQATMLLFKRMMTPRYQMAWECPSDVWQVSNGYLPRFIPVFNVHP
jgi:hypothetical protein